MLNLPPCSVCGKTYDDNADKCGIWRDLKVRHPQLRQELHAPTHYVICPQCYNDIIKEHWTRYRKEKKMEYNGEDLS